MALTVNNFPAWVVERLRRYFDLFVSDVRKVNNSNQDIRIPRLRAIFEFSAPSDEQESASYRNAESNAVKCKVSPHILQVVRTANYTGVDAEVSYTAIAQRIVTVSLADEFTLPATLARDNSADRIAALRDQFVVAFLSLPSVMFDFPLNEPIALPAVPSQPEQALFEVHTALRTDTPGLVNSLDFGNLVISGSGILFEREAGVFPYREPVKSQSFTAVIPPTGDEPYSYELQLDAYPMALKNGPLFFYDMVEAGAMDMDEFTTQIHLPYFRSVLSSYINQLGYADSAAYYGITGIQWLSWFPWWSSIEASSPSSVYPAYSEDWQVFLFGDAENAWYSTYKIAQFWEDTLDAANDLAPNGKSAFVGLISTAYVTDDFENDSHFQALREEVPFNQNALNVISKQGVLLPTVILNGNVKANLGDSTPGCADSEDYDDFAARASAFAEIINQYHALFPAKPVYLAITLGVIPANLFEDPETTDVCEATTSTWNSWFSLIFSQCPYIQGVYLYLPFKVNSGNIDAVSTSLANVVNLLELYQRNGI